MDKSHRLIICSPQLGISPKTTLGGEVYDREVIERMANFGAEIHILLPKNRPYNKTKNVYVEYAPLKHIIPPYLYSIIMLPFLFKKYSRIKFDILRVHSHFLGLGVVFFKVIHPNIKLVTHYHLDHEGLFVNLVNKILFKYSDLIIADSFYLKRQLSKKFSKEKGKIAVIHTGVDHQSIIPTKADDTLINRYRLQGKVVITFMGRFIKRKNPLFLVRLMKILPKNTVLVLIGKGPQEEEIKKEAKLLGLEDRILMPGILFGSRKLSYYSISDIFVFPSLNEGFVLAVLEAMAAGLPLVLPNSGAFPEALSDGINGYLAKPNNVDDWVKKLTRLINDQNLRMRMGEASRKLVLSKFTWDKVAEDNIKAYLSLLK